MAIRYILSEYVGQAMAEAFYDKLEDDTFAGRIPSCKGVLAFGATLRECEDELRSTLEDWILVGLKLGHTLPVIGSIDLNKEPIREPVDTVINVGILFGDCANLALMAPFLEPGINLWSMSNTAWLSL